MAMKSAGDLVTAALASGKRSANEPRGGSGSSSNDILPPDWIRALFAKFTVRYGHKWTSPLDSDAMMKLAIDEWSRGLAGLTGEEIRRGLDEWQGEWPPTLSEFKAVCKPKRHAAHRQYKALPRPLPDKAKAKTALRRMKAALRSAFCQLNPWQEIHGMRRYV